MDININILDYDYDYSYISKVYVFSLLLF